METGEVEWDVDAFALVGPHLIIWIAISTVVITLIMSARLNSFFFLSFFSFQDPT